MNSEEHQIQVACVNWFRMQYPKLQKYLFAIPNGGKRHVIVASKMKKEGVQKGVPDLFLALPRIQRDQSMVYGLFIEMKSSKGRTTPEQKEYLELLDSVGYECKVCKSFDEFQQVIKNYL